MTVAMPVTVAVTIAGQSLTVAGTLIVAVAEQFQSGGGSCSGSGSGSGGAVP